MKYADTQKTPVAVLGGLRDEGLNPTPTKEQNMRQSTVPTRIELDQFATIDVDPRDDGVEVTFSTRNEFGETRSTFGIALTPEEARKLASALLDGVAPDLAPADPVEIPVSDLAAGTVVDIFRWSKDNDVPITHTMQTVETYLRDVQEAEGVSPAEWCRRRRAEKQGARA